MDKKQKFLSHSSRPPVAEKEKGIPSSAYSLAEVKAFLKGQLRIQIRLFSGNDSDIRLEQIANNWFDDQNNYDGRWSIIRERMKKESRILDMSCGCGTFLLYGLHNGWDVWGIEPETWKRSYYRMKIQAAGYSSRYAQRFIAALGETLPFADSSFDLVTTYQTLEHVQDVRACMQEMLRVLKPGGILYIIAPDYSGWLEPHYGILFLHKINKRMARVYLKLRGRPLAALEALQWISEKQLIANLQSFPYPLKISRPGEHTAAMAQERLTKKSRNFIVQPESRKKMSSLVQSVKRRLRRMGSFWREPKTIDLWVTKIR